MILCHICLPARSNVDCLDTQMIDGEEKKPVDDDCGSGDTLGTCNYVHKTMTKGEFV